MNIELFDEVTDIEEEVSTSPPINRLKSTKELVNPLKTNKGKADFSNPESFRFITKNVRSPIGGFEEVIILPAKTKLTLQQTRNCRSTTNRPDKCIDSVVQSEIEMSRGMVRHNKKHSSGKILVYLRNTQRL